MVNAIIDFVGTERFWNKYSGNPSTKLDDCKSYCENRWDYKIDQGNRGADFYSHTSSSDQIPENFLPSNTDFFTDRVISVTNDMDEWLKNNWSLYDTSDCVMVLDWYEENVDEEDETYGVAYDNAGGAAEKTGAVDVWYEDKNELPYEWGSERSEGISWHELAHVWSATHNDASIDSNYDMSLEWNWGDAAGCNPQSGGTDQITRWVTSCTTNDIQSHFDNNI
jgi:hypothetical protein